MRSKKYNETFFENIESIDFSKIKERTILRKHLNYIKTVDLMTLLCYNNCYDLVEESIDALLLFNYLGGQAIYIVSKDNQRFSFKKTGEFCGKVIMTDLKRPSVFREVLNSLRDNDIKSILLPTEKILHISNKPYLLNAMTHFDRNYGNKYCGQELIEEGNLYGDTSEFYIIGYTEFVE